MARRSAPRGLAAAGRRLWSQIAGSWDLRPDELRILEDACREADLIDDLAAAAAGAEKLVRGAQGQPVINPLISELRQHRTALRSLLKTLDLPDESGQAPRSVAARKAVTVRWNKPA